MKKKKKLGEILLEAGVIDEFKLRAALSYQSEWGGRLGAIIVKKGFMTEKELLSVIMRQSDIESISLNGMPRPHDEILKLIKPEIARKFCVFPIDFDGRTLKAAMADPTDLKTLDDLSFMLGVRVKPLLALESEILRAIQIYYDGRPYFGRSSGEAAAAGTQTPVRSAPSQFTPPSSQKQQPAETVFSQKEVLSGLVDLLIDKGLITKDELLKKIVLKGIHAVRVED